MQVPRPWLCQGDVFRSVPIVYPRQVDDQIKFESRSGAALLLTENCQLDKIGPGEGQPAIRRLVFAPIWPLTALATSMQRLLREHQVNPPEGVYLDDIGVGQETTALLGEAYQLPASYFSVSIQDFHGTPGLEPHAVRLVANRNADRLCSMTTAERLLLHDKMTVFWTRMRAEGSTLFDPGVGIS